MVHYLSADYTSFNGRSTTTDVSVESVDFIRMTPDTTYTFKVRACKKQGASHLYSPWSSTVNKKAPMPTSQGHQEDHTVAYQEDSINSAPGHPSGIPDPATVIRDSISRAVNAWNNATRLNIPAMNLKICEVRSCGTSNHDNKTIKIQTAGETSPGQNNSCGNSVACTKDATPRMGEHIAGIDFILEEPAWWCRGTPDPVTGACPSADHTRIYWTSIERHHNTSVSTSILPAGSPASLYFYIDPIMIHEFGHTFGLHDFYLDPTMAPLVAIMKDVYANTMITAEDIAQLRAIYALHNSFPHSEPVSILVVDGHIGDFAEAVGWLGWGWGR